MISTVSLLRFFASVRLHFFRVYPWLLRLRLLGWGVGSGGSQGGAILLLVCLAFALFFLLLLASLAVALAFAVLACRSVLVFVCFFNPTVRACHPVLTSFTILLCLFVLFLLSICLFKRDP